MWILKTNVAVGCHPLLFPFIGTSVISNLVIVQEGEHAFRQDFIHENDNHLLPELWSNLGTVIIETAIAFCEGVLVESVLVVHSLFGDLKNFSVHNL